MRPHSRTRGPCGHPRALADLARIAEYSGWDAVLLEDYIIHGIAPGQIPVYDPWIALAAMAAVTSRIRIGTLVTPLPRRRPWKVACEALTIDHLSNGRMILGVGRSWQYADATVFARTARRQKVRSRRRALFSGRC